MSNGWRRWRGVDATPDGLPSPVGTARSPRASMTERPRDRAPHLVWDASPRRARPCPTSVGAGDGTDETPRGDLGRGVATRARGPDEGRRLPDIRSSLPTRASVTGVRRSGRRRPVPRLLAGGARGNPSASGRRLEGRRSAEARVGCGDTSGAGFVRRAVSRFAVGTPREARATRGEVEPRPARGASPCRCGDFPVPWRGDGQRGTRGVRGGESRHRVRWSLGGCVSARTGRGRGWSKRAIAETRASEAEPGRTGVTPDGRVPTPAQERPGTRTGRGGTSAPAQAGRCSPTGGRRSHGPPNACVSTSAWNGHGQIRETGSTPRSESGSEPRSGTATGSPEAGSAGSNQETRSKGVDGLPATVGCRFPAHGDVRRAAEGTRVILWTRGKGHEGMAAVGDTSAATRWTEDREDRSLLQGHGGSTEPMGC